MKFMKYRSLRVSLFVLSALVLAGFETSSRSQNVQLTGRVHNLLFLDQMLPAEIRFYEFNPTNFEPRSPLVADAKTGADGRYAVKLDAGFYLVEVKSDGFKTVHALFEKHLATDTLDLSLAQDLPQDPESTLIRVSGRLVDSEGKEILDATVTLNSVLDSTSGAPVPDQTRTDKEGRFELQTWDRGYYILSAASPTKGVAARVIRLTGAATQELEEPLVLIRLEP